MYRIRKIFKFEGAHALTSSYTRECQKIHGHSYKVEVFLQSESLNEDGMIVDFKRLKEGVGHIFDDWDHLLVLQAGDKRFGNAGAAFVGFNPTAENMAKHFFRECQKEFGSSISKVRVHETATGWAEYWEDK